MHDTFTEKIYNILRYYYVPYIYPAVTADCNVVKPSGKRFYSVCEESLELT